MSLFSFKRNWILENATQTEPALFDAFKLWVLEYWVFVPVNGTASPLNYRNDGLIGRDDLEDFLFRRRKFELNKQPSGPGFQGRLRLVFTIKQSPADPLLSMALGDFELLERHLALHPSTLQYVRRTMKASKFWGNNGNTLNLLLALPPAPLIRFNSISLNYDCQSRSTNALVGELDWIHDELNVGHFKNMLENSSAYWAHPLIVPILLLDMLMYTLEREIITNIASIKKMENQVFELPSLDMDARPLAERENVTRLLSDLHGILKDAIKLLDAAHWMQRVTDMLLETGEELRAKFNTNKLGLQHEWTDMEGFLQDMSRLTALLEPDPIMTQQRCQSQIDILNSKIAQEDNLLAARLAVSATRDSSAMKALAVITALFLPGTYIASLFSMSMFNWQGGGSSSSSSGGSQSAIVMPYIWIYWLVSVVLTLVTVLGWRFWWVIEDREFRRRLPTVVRSTAFDEGRIQVTKPASDDLKNTVWEDFWGMDSRKKHKDVMP